MSITSAIGIPMALPDWLLVTGIALLASYLYATWTYDFFKKRKVHYLKPFPLLGNVKSVVFRSHSMAEMVQCRYNDMKGHRAAGMFDFRNPILMIRDPALIKLVCIKEFDHFVNRRQAINEKLDPLFSKSLFALRDKRWKDTRTTLSPAFTSSKMKAMFLLISDCGRQARDYLEQCCREQPGGPVSVLPIELKDFFTRFATDVIATSAFGVKCDSLRQPKNEFYLMGKEITSFTGLKSLLFLIYVLIPKLAELMGISFFSKRATDFFTSMVRENIRTREKEGIVRLDMLHLMNEASKAGKHDPNKLSLDEDDIAAQSILFFFAGFETVTTLMCFCSYHLALHPDLQERLQQEIDSVLEEHNGELTYDTLQEMKYLDMVMSETLRMYPPSPLVDRQCVKPLFIPGTDTQPPLTFEKGDIIWIPIHGLHHDQKYFPEPEKFDPERFSEERSDNIEPFTYIPFGLGPRVCIAQRFALMEAKVGLAYFLSRFTLNVTEKTTYPLKLSTTSFTTNSATGYWCGVKLRNVQK